MKFTSFYSSMKNIYYTSRAILRTPLNILKKNRIPLNCRIGKSVVVYGSKLGQYCYVGQNCTLNNVVMGNYCSIAPNVQIGGMEHSWWWGSTSTRLSNYCVDQLQTIIEDDVWIGANAVVRQGVRIGRGAVVGAAALVLADVKPYSLVVGAPARYLKNRFSPAVQRQVEASKFWNFPPQEARKLLTGIEFEMRSTTDDASESKSIKDPSY